METTRKRRNRIRRSQATIRGIVSPASWDADGSVASVCVATDDGTPCFVLPGGAGDDLRHNLKRYVAVTGLIERRGREHFIRVESVRRIPHPDGTPDEE